MPAEYIHVPQFTSTSLGNKSITFLTHPQALNNAGTSIFGYASGTNSIYRYDFATDNLVLLGTNSNLAGTINSLVVDETNGFIYVSNGATPSLIYRLSLSNPTAAPSATYTVPSGVVTISRYSRTSGTVLLSNRQLLSSTLVLITTVGTAGEGILAWFQATNEFLTSNTNIVRYLNAATGVVNRSHAVGATGFQARAAVYAADVDRFYAFLSNGQMAVWNPTAQTVEGVFDIQEGVINAGLTPLLLYYSRVKMLAWVALGTGAQIHRLYNTADNFRYLGDIAVNNGARQAFGTTQTDPPYLIFLSNTTVFNRLNLNTVSVGLSVTTPVVMPSFLSGSLITDPIYFPANNQVRLNATVGYFDLDSWLGLASGPTTEIQYNWTRQENTQATTNSLLWLNGNSEITGDFQITIANGGRLRLGTRSTYNERFVFQSGSRLEVSQNVSFPNFSFTGTTIDNLSSNNVTVQVSSAQAAGLTVANPTTGGGAITLQLPSATFSAPNINLGANGEVFDNVQVRLSKYYEATVTSVNTGTSRLNITNNVVPNGTMVMLRGEDLPQPLDARAFYYAVNSNNTGFQVSGTIGGPAITFTDSGSGVITLWGTLELDQRIVTSGGYSVSLQGVIDGDLLLFQAMHLKDSRQNVSPAIASKYFEQVLQKNGLSTTTLERLELDEVHNAFAQSLGYDGYSIRNAEFMVDPSLPALVQIDVNDPSNETSTDRAYLYYAYYQGTLEGMRALRGYMIGENINSIRILGELTVQNVNPNYSLLVSGPYLYRADGKNWADSFGKGIVHQPVQTRGLILETQVPFDLNAGDRARLAAILSLMQSVWQSGTGSTGGSGPTPADIWNHPTRSLTDKSGFELTTAEEDTIAAKVWAVNTRTLTSFGTLVADIVAGVWNAGSRTLTGFGSLVSDIWSNPGRTLTSVDKAGYTLTPEERTAIATAVDTALADNFANVTVDLSPVTSAITQRPTLAQIEASTVLSKETTSQAIKSQTDKLAFNGTDVLATLDSEVVTVAPASVTVTANAVDAVLEDDFSQLEQAINNIPSGSGGSGGSVIRL